jgi:Fe2+ or Zn2+ uptake regulation protein
LHDVESKLQFLGDGTIQSNNLQFNQEINNVLNLNESSLTRNRKAILSALQQSFMRENLSKIAIEKELRKWNGDDGG